ncbi:hypothetical protein [Pseudodesulfovibrio sp.]|uniref:hypothetical protein n=1 Tax=unclassified Pseudodesulfovibrio TaxID=2661612 RepID=UPI003AFF7652
MTKAKENDAVKDEVSRDKHEETPLPESQDEQLTEAELEQVAGGYISRPVILPDNFQ